jgi:hypothetical protein
VDSSYLLDVMGHHLGCVALLDCEPFHSTISTVRELLKTGSRRIRNVRLVLIFPNSRNNRLLNKIIKEYHSVVSETIRIKQSSGRENNLGKVGIFLDPGPDVVFRRGADGCNQLNLPSYTTPLHPPQTLYKQLP